MKNGKQLVPSNATMQSRQHFKVVIPFKAQNCYRTFPDGFRHGTMKSKKFIKIFGFYW